MAQPQPHPAFPSELRPQLRELAAAMARLLAECVRQEQVSPRVTPAGALRRAGRGA